MSIISINTVAVSVCPPESVTLISTLKLSPCVSLCSKGTDNYRCYHTNSLNINLSMAVAVVSSEPSLERLKAGKGEPTVVASNVSGSIPFWSASLARMADVCSERRRRYKRIYMYNGEHSCSAIPV